MRYNAIITILFLSFSSLLAAPKIDGTPNVVRMLINNLELLTNLSESQGDEAYKIYETNKKLFDSNNNINECNTEIFYLGLKPVHTSDTYCHRLYTLLYEERVLKLAHVILYTEPIIIADDGKDELCFYDTKVKKTCTYKNDETIVWQTLEVNKNGLIDKMKSFKSRPSDWKDGNINETKQETRNRENKEQSSSNSNTIQKVQDIPPIQEPTPQSEQDLIRLAARYYTSKDYSSAANTLNTLTEIYPNNAEAWFRLACIVRYKTKWSKEVYKDPNKSAIEFMKKASALANGKLKSKADNALFYWEHPNYM